MKTFLVCIFLITLTSTRALQYAYGPSRNLRFPETESFSTVVVDWRMKSSEPSCCCAQLFRIVHNQTIFYDIGCHAHEDCVDLMKNVSAGEIHRSILNIHYLHDIVMVSVKVQSTVTDKVLLDQKSYVSLEHPLGEPGTSSFGIYGNCTNTGIDIVSILSVSGNEVAQEFDF